MKLPHKGYFCNNISVVTSRQPGLWQNVDNTIAILLTILESLSENQDINNFLRSHVETRQTSNQCPVVHSNSRASQITGPLDHKLDENRNCVSPFEDYIPSTKLSFWHSQCSRNICWGWRCGSVVRLLPSRHEALGLISSTTKIIFKRKLSVCVHACVHTYVWTSA